MFISAVYPSSGVAGAVSSYPGGNNIFLFDWFVSEFYGVRMLAEGRGDGSGR